MSRCSLGRGWVPDPSLDGGGPNPALDGGGVPDPALDWGGPNPALEGGYPNLGWGGAPSPGGAHLRVPRYPPGIASTCYGYMAGGVPLAFTQEDFLVNYNYDICLCNRLRLTN